MTTGRGLVEEEEKRSYGAVFLFAIGVLVACMVWAIWQDAFSRHLWKKFKTDFYRIAIAKYDKDIVAEEERLAKDPEYIKLRDELAALRQSLESGEAKAELDRLQARKDELAIQHMEADQDVRIVKGEVEEAWYWLEHAQHHGQTGAEEHKHLEATQKRAEEYVARLDRVTAEMAAVEADMEKVRGREKDLVEKMRPYNKEIESLTTRLDGVSLNLFGRRVAAVPTIEQVVLVGFERNNFENWVDRVERCQNCHVAIDRPGFEDQQNPLKTHPDRAYYLGNHEVRSFGCTPCHGGQGASINAVELAHGKVAFWEDPLLNVADKVESKCLTCHASVQNVAGAETAARGEWLFQEMGCHGCHLTSGFEDLEKVGPSLSRIAAKVSPEWLVSWIENPQGFRPRTRMPNYMFKREEAVSIAAYLLQSSQEASKAWLAAQVDPPGVDANDPALVEKGKQLTRDLGCLGCHGFAPEEFASQVAIGKDTAPNLARIAEKTDGRWIYPWIRNPLLYSEHPRMPSLRLTEEEASAITSYLLTLRQGPSPAPDDELRATLAKAETVQAGEKLIRKYGCFGCHTVTGMEGESRIGVELSSFGGKHFEELYFGDRLDIPPTWDDWTINKILTPRTYATERIEQVMPQFGFDVADARALTVFLASRTEHVINPKYKPSLERENKLKRGRELVARYNCQGCHSFDGREGAIRRYFTDNVEYAPPILLGEGSKVQAEWFFDFLMKPVKLRPWLTLRMPTFPLTDRDASDIIDYFQALDGYEFGPVILEAGGAGAGPARVETVSQLPAGSFDCFSCHAEGTVVPTSQYHVAKTPLTPERAREWLGGHVEPQTGSTAQVEQAAPSVTN
ncbi:MAG TPA: c-type cytochrome [Candidatus Limnocylindrales bacterium]|nr:c-type cytochrome [Candidatus Limnocylindrales bacterium]